MGFFHTVFYQPTYNGLIAIHHILPVHDLGLAIIGITIVLLAILYWPSLVQIRSSISLQQLQPKLKALREKYGGNREELARQTMALYREHKFNPASACLPLIIQLPIFWTLYKVLISGVSIDPATHLLRPDQLANLYGPLRTIYETTTISTISFGIIDVAAKHNIILAVLVAASQLYLSRLLKPTLPGNGGKDAKDESTTAAVFRQMNYITPFTFGFIAYILPAGLSLYYITWNIFQIIQRQLLARAAKPKPETGVVQ